MDSKKQWQKPELVVLVRNKPEEAVLLICKNGAGSPGPDEQTFAQCDLYSDPCGVTACSYFMPS